MRCDEIQERFVELLYPEQEGEATSAAIRAHVRSCPECQKELDELKAVRRALGTWKDEAPLRPVNVAIQEKRLISFPSRSLALRATRYAAVAAMVIFAFLILANAEITWNKEGFAFRTHLFSSPGLGSHSGDYYTKAEVRDILKRVIDDSEYRMTEVNYVMMQSMLETIDGERQRDLQLISNRLNQSRSKN